MPSDRAFFALVFASALLAFTAVWGESGLMIDPDGKPASATATTNGGATPLQDSGLMIDPNG